MKNEDVFSVEVPVFTNSKGEVLSLTEIMKGKKIVSVKINYLSKLKKVRIIGGVKGFFRMKEKRQELKNVTINDDRGITLYYTEGIEGVSIRFWDKKEFDKLADEDYSDDTLWRRYVMTIVNPYQINFHIGNLVQMDWVQK